MICKLHLHVLIDVISVSLSMVEKGESSANTEGDLLLKQSESLSENKSLKQEEGSFKKEKSYNKSSIFFSLSAQMS